MPFIISSMRQETGDLLSMRYLLNFDFLGSEDSGSLETAFIEKFSLFFPICVGLKLLSWTSSPCLLGNIAGIL